jgi:hypothetical protein
LLSPVFAPITVTPNTFIVLSYAKSRLLSCHATTMVNFGGVSRWVCLRLVPSTSSGDRTMGTDLDDNGGDGLIGAEVGVGAAGVLLRELAHDLHRLVAGIGRCSRCSPPPDSIQCISNFSFFSQRRDLWTRKYLELGRRVCGSARWTPSTTRGRGAPRSRRWVA